MHTSKHRARERVRHKDRVTKRNKEVQMKNYKERKNLERQRETKSRTGKRKEIYGGGIYR